MDNKRPKSRFQSTLPRRERLPATPKLEHFRYFNPRSREGSDYLFCTFTIFFSISIHAPAKGATFCGNWYLTSGKNFNPRSREGSDVLISYLSNNLNISIHAPAKGATAYNPLSNLYFLISIHAPAKGATIGEKAAQAIYEISIHAPAKGATIKVSEKLTKYAFQSTLPRRERLSFHAHGGSTFAISIHAPAKGATCTIGNCIVLVTISIHAPSKGATMFRQFYIKATFQFQSTLPRRERRRL